MQIQIRANSTKEAAKKFFKRFPKQFIFDISREFPGGYRVTSVSKGVFPKWKLSRYNRFGHRGF